jgi:hypothetical protein
VARALPWIKFGQSSYNAQTLNQKALMKNQKYIYIAGMLSVSLLQGFAGAADLPVRTTPEKPPIQAPPVDLKPGAPVVRPQPPTTPAKPETPERANPKDEVKDLIDKFERTKNEFLDEQKKLHREMAKESSKEAREKIRAEIKVKREAFLDQQKEAREEIRKRLTDLKQELKEHRDVLDEAKDEAKDKAKDRAKNRKGGG